MAGTSSSKAHGTTLKIGSITVGNLTSINGVEITVDTRDVTTLDSPDGFKEFESGFADGNEVSADGIMKDKGVDAAALVALIGGENQECEISFPNGAKWEFSGPLTRFSTGAELEDNILFSVAVKVSGKPTLTAGSA